MFRKLHLLYFLFFANYTISQVSNPDFYREDQFYFSIYYNSIKNGVDELKENKFSSSLNFGFIRDFPLNKSGKFKNFNFNDELVKDTCIINNLK